MPKVIVLLRMPLTPRDRERFGIDFMRANGCKLTLVDLSAWLSGGRMVSVSSADVVIDGGFKFAQFLWRNRRYFFLDLANLHGADLRSYSPLIWLFGIRYAAVRCGLVPSADLSQAKMRNFLDMVHQAFTRFSNLIRLKSSLLLRLNRPALVFIGGEAGRSSEFASSKVVPAHSFDFEVFRSARSGLRAGADRIVFIDQHLPHHVENQIFDNGLRIDADSYYARLRAVFDKVETLQGQSVIVLAHPRAHYVDRDPLFGGREVLFGQTLQQISQASLVLTHGSTAVNFAAILRKPLLYLMTPEIQKSNDSPFVYAQASMLAAPVTDMTDVEENVLQRAMSVDKTAYDTYCARYIRCPEAPDDALSSIFLNEIALAANINVRRSRL